jgi:hypothetical protein
VRGVAGCIVAVAALTLAATLHASQPAEPPAPEPASAPQTFPPSPIPVPANGLDEEFASGLRQAVVRLPLAALLGTVLAIRPRRGPAPPRDPAVVETQIILAIVGSLIMLIIGASLARAFGIAGAANLIRYRAKVDDPKDAVVMLSALSVGLASGVGLIGIAVGATAFLAVVLWIIEGFQNRVRNFLLTVKLGEDTDGKRERVERILQAAKTTFELRTTGDGELSYLVTAPESLRTERLSAALARLSPQGKAQIEWKEEPKVRPLPEKETP